MAETSNAKWTVRECRERVDIEALFRFRYLEYVERQGHFKDTADHENRLLSDPVDMFGINFAAFALEEQVVGSIRLNCFDKYVQTYCLTGYNILGVGPDALNKGCAVTRAMVHPDWRSTPVFADLALAAARKMPEIGLRWMFIDTSTFRAANDEEKFKSLYRSMGFKVWQQDALVPGIGYGTAMLLDLDEAMADRRTLVSLYLGSTQAQRSGERQIAAAAETSRPQPNRSLRHILWFYAVNLPNRRYDLTPAQRLAF